MARTKITLASTEYEKWMKVIKDYESSFKRWETRAERIVKRYKDDSRYDRNPNARFNILWSTVQTITPAVFARLPQPDVSRRFRDNDPVGRVASMMLERALDFEISHYSDYKSAMANAVLDRLLGGRGVSWVRYEPHIIGKEPDDGVEVTEDSDDSESLSESAQQEQIENEVCPCDYVHWREFGHSANARTWEEVTTVWRKVFMGRKALVERFGEELGSSIPLDTRPEDLKQSYKPMEGSSEALIYELWDKESGKVYWISKSLGKIIDERDDPLELENFWPCPKPLYATLTTDSLEPIPDFSIYQDQARELDTLADRIEGLINALKVRGVYDASVSELARLFSEGENNTLIPVKNYMAFAEKQGFKGTIDLVDIAPFAQALQQCYEAMDQVKNQIYELMGIADIQRGQSDPNETLGAQIIKSNNASGRLRTMQHAVVDFATQLLQIKGQIICNHYTDETIVKISGAMQLSDADKQYIGPALQLLRDESAKNFRIEVTSDSMIFQDEQQEKQDRVEFLKAVGAFMTQALPVAQSSPELTPMLMEMLKFGVTAFKAGKQMEGIIDQTADKFREMAKQQEGKPPPPSPEMQKAQIEAQSKQAEIQANSQAKQAEMQMQAQLHQQEAQNKMAIEQHKQEMQAQENMQRNQLEHERAMADRQAEEKLAIMKLQMERRTQLELAYLNNGAKIEVARIGSENDDGEAAYQLEESRASADSHPLAPVASAINDGNNQLGQIMSQLVQTLQAQHEASSRPKTVVRGADGKIVGVK